MRSRLPSGILRIGGLCVAVLLLCAACHSSTATPTRDGSTRARAIQLQAHTHGAGVRAEHAWLQKHLPGARLADFGKTVAGEDVVHFGHRTEADDTTLFSVYTMQLPDGTLREVFFDQGAYFRR